MHLRDDVRAFCMSRGKLAFCCDYLWVIFTNAKPFFKEKKRLLAINRNWSLFEKSEKLSPAFVLFN